MKCEEHGKEAVTHCNWCSKPICNECLEISEDKKYCEACYKKLKPDEVHKRTSHLTESMGLKEQREKFGGKKTEKHKPRIRNIP
jgi:hypothetical protein